MIVNEENPQPQATICISKASLPIPVTPKIIISSLCTIVHKFSWYLSGELNVFFLVSHYFLFENIHKFLLLGESPFWSFLGVKVWHSLILDFCIDVMQSIGRALLSVTPGGPLPLPFAPGWSGRHGFFFHKKHTLDTLHFTISEHWADSPSIFLRAQPWLN